MQLRSFFSAQGFLGQVHEQTLLKPKILRDAIDLVRNSSTPEAALKARIVGYFVGKHPGIDAPVVIKSFEDALRNCESDRAALPMQRSGLCRGGGSRAALATVQTPDGIHRGSTKG
jgi:hypothetical protein